MCVTSTTEFKFAGVTFCEKVRKRFTSQEAIAATNIDVELAKLKRGFSSQLSV